MRIAEMRKRLFNSYLIYNIMNLQSQLNFDKASFFTYELIQKSDTKKFIDQFDKFATQKPKEGPDFSFTFYGRDHTAVEHQWEVNDLEQCWKEIEKELGYFDKVDTTKEYVNTFELFIVELPYLPYDTIILKSQLNHQKISQIHSRNDLLNILFPLNRFMDRFPGIISKSNNSGKYRPCYLKFEIEDSGKNIEKNLKQIKQFDSLKNLESDKDKKQYFDLSKKFRHIHFEKEWQKSDLLSINFKQNSFSILGFLFQLPNQMSHTTYEIIFKKQQRTVNWAQNTAFRRLDYDFSTFFHFSSISLFLTHTINQIDKLDADFINLVSKYKALKTKNFKEQEELYQKITDLSETLFFIKSDLNLTSFELENPLSMTMHRIPNYNLLNENDYSSKNSFSRGLLQAIFENSKNSITRITEKLSINQKKVDDLKEKFDKKITFENSQASVDLAIQSSKTQSTMKNQGYATIVLSVVIIVLTIALLQSTGNLLEYTSTQFQIENFESEFMINNPHIVLREWHSFDQFDYLTPIEINSLTSHNYRLTAYPIVDSFELQSFGECFLGSAPEIVMIEPSIFFVDSGANDRTIEPTFRLGFEKFPYSNQINKENSVYHSVGKIQFEIVAQNLQIPSDTRVFQKNVGVSIPYPSDAADRLCKK